MIRSIGIAWWSWKGLASTALDLRAWAPLVLVTVLRIAVLLFTVFFHQPLWVGLGAPMVEFLGGPDASHYPEHLLVVPRIFAALDPWILVIGGALALPGVARTLAAKLSGLPRARFAGGRRTRDVGAVVLLLVLIDAAIGSLFGFLPEALRASSGKIELVLAVLRAGMLVLAASPFVCAVGSIVVRDEAVWPALQRSIRIASTNPVTVVLITALPVLASVPFHVLAGAFGRGKLESMPEAMVLVVATRLLVELVMVHATATAAVRVALWNAAEDA